MDCVGDCGGNGRKHMWMLLKNLLLLLEVVRILRNMMLNVIVVIDAVDSVYS